MDGMLEVRNISVSILRSPKDVYAFSSNGKNLPRWATGLDHDVVLESGATVHNPMRVIPNGSGSTVIFTLLRLPGVSEQKFGDDAKWVEKDLTTLKEILEKSP
jgi:hypothetical protein